MSDPVTNVQIEDVLSSIRKLVSEEVRSQTREAAAAQNAAPETPAKPAPVPDEGRLILTPALRVDAPDKDEADFVHAEEEHHRAEADLLNLMERVRAAGAEDRAQAQPSPAPTPVDSNDAGDDTTPEQAIESALAALAAGHVAEDQPATAPEDAALQDDTFLTVSEDVSFSDDADDDDEAALTFAEAAADDDLSDGQTDNDETETVIPTFLRHRGVTSLHQRVSDVETVVRDQGGDWEPEADEDTDAAPGPQSGSVPWSAEDDDAQDQEEAPAAVAPVADTAEFDVQKDDHHTDDHDDVWNVDPVQDVEKAAMEDATRSHLRLAGGDDVDMSGHHDETAEDAGGDHVETIAQAFANAQAEEDAAGQDWEDVDYADDLVAAEDQQALTSDEPSVIDEEMLRDMVAEIVRQELQGALGERITRNVRKLVRREIHRALSAHNID